MYKEKKNKMEMFLQQENRECKCFFRLDVESFDKESVFIAGRHSLHCTTLKTK